MENISGSVVAFLKYNGSVVTDGEFGLWTPVGAKQTGDGYEVVWSLPGADQYVVWNVDSNGNYISNATGIFTGDSAALEANFGELGHGGEFPAPGGTTPATPFTINTSSTTTLASIASTGQAAFFELNPAGGGTGPLLELHGALVTDGQFGAGWTPLVAIQTGDGYEVAWAT